MKRTPALARLEKRLATDASAILNDAEVRVLDREVWRALLASFPGIEAHLNHSEDSTRWHALGARCRRARGARGIRDVSVALGIPQYRLRAIEGGLLREVRADLGGAVFTSSESTRGSPVGAARIGSWPLASVRWTAYGHGRAATDSLLRKRIAKPTCWVVDMRHYLDDETNDLPEAIPERVFGLAVFFGATVAWVTDHLPEGDWLTNVPCRRSLGRRRCRGR